MLGRNFPQNEKQKVHMPSVCPVVAESCLMPCFKIVDFAVQSMPSISPGLNPKVSVRGSGQARVPGVRAWGLGIRG